MKLDCLFGNDTERRRLILQMSNHNKIAFAAAERAITREKKLLEEKQWIEEFGSLDNYIQYAPMVMVTHSEAMDYVKKHFGYAELAKDGWFGWKIIYDRGEKK